MAMTLNPLPGEVSPLKRNIEIIEPVEKENVPPTKKLKIDATPGSDNDAVASTEDQQTEATEHEKPLTKKQLDKIERQKQRELEKEERDRKKEEERKQKEEERKCREEERKKKLEEKELEKEQRRKKLEEEKLERERKKEEERIKKLAEKEEKDKQRLDKKLKMEMEKKKAEEEKRKAEVAKKQAEEAKKRAEEKSQMRISSFFTPKKQGNDVPASSSATPTVSTQERESSDSSSKNATNVLNFFNASPSKPSKPSRTTYEKVFLPFFQRTNVVIAHPSSLLDTELKQQRDEFDSILSASSVSDVSKYQNFIRKKTNPNPASIPKLLPSPELIITALNSPVTTENEICNMIEKLPPLKYLQFYENSKPPYIGTWCSTAHNIADFPNNNPYFKVPNGIDYDYDSDFDWNEDGDGEEGEGEDIDNDDDDDEDEEIDDEDGGEFEDFVDTNGDMHQKKKKKYMGPLVSLSIWNDGTDKEFFESMSYERINEKIEFPILPNKNYWSRKKVVEETPKTEKVDAKEKKTKVTGGAGSSPLKIDNVIGSKSSPNLLVAQKPKIKDPKVVLELIKFIEENNDFSIGTLVELAHKKIKSYTKATIKHTVQYVATYNKKSGNWEIKQQVKDRIANGEPAQGSDTNSNKTADTEEGKNSPEPEKAVENGTLGVSEIAV